MNMKNKTISIVLSLVLMFGIAGLAKAEETTNNEFAEAKQIISSQIPCQQLSDSQLEKIGDYIMEETAPGSTHTQMDEMMGGEGSESLKQAHIFMARRWYCADATGYGMMGMMNGSWQQATNRSNPISNFQPTAKYQTMMGAYYQNGNWLFTWMVVLHVLAAIFLIVGIAAFIKYITKKK